MLRHARGSARKALHPSTTRRDRESDLAIAIDTDAGVRCAKVNADHVILVLAMDTAQTIEGA